MNLQGALFAGLVAMLSITAMTHDFAAADLRFERHEFIPMLNQDSAGAAVEFGSTRLVQQAGRL